MMFYIKDIEFLSKKCSKKYTYLINNKCSQLMVLSSILNLLFVYPVALLFFCCNNLYISSTLSKYQKHIYIIIS